MMIVSRQGSYWRVGLLYIWRKLPFPSTHGTFLLQVVLFCFQGLLVGYLNMWSMWSSVSLLHCFVYVFTNLDQYISHFEELYQQMLAKALAHFFEAKLLLLDVTDFLLKVGGKRFRFSFGFSLYLDVVGLYRSRANMGVRTKNLWVFSIYHLFWARSFFFCI